MQEQFNKQNFWVKTAIVCVVIAVIFNFFSIGLAFAFTTLIGLFVDVLLFVILDVFLAALLFAVSIFVSAVGIFISLLLGLISLIGYTLLIAVVVVPLALLYKYNQSQQVADEAEYK